jgi:hypothetical protein
MAVISQVFEDVKRLTVTLENGVDDVVGCPPAGPGRGRHADNGEGRSRRRQDRYRPIVRLRAENKRHS